MITDTLIVIYFMAVVQRKANMLRWNMALGLPFLILAAWQIIAPPNPQDNTLVYIASALAAAILVFLFVRFAGEYLLDFKLLFLDPEFTHETLCQRLGMNHTTFRKAFQEVMGCLPSEVKK